MTSRRGFLGALLGAAVLDPEKLLWVPGARVISIPRPSLPTSGVAIARRAKIGDTLMVRGPVRFLPSESWPMPLMIAGQLQAFTVIGFGAHGDLITAPRYEPKGPPR